MDATVIVINAEAPITIDPVAHFVTQWLSDNGLSREDVDISSSRRSGETSKFLAVQFLGVPRTAAGRAFKLLGSLRNTDGTWKSTAVPFGGSHVRLFISADKSPKMVTTEIHTKIARKIMAAEFPQLRFSASTRDGVISNDQVPLVRIVAEARRQSHAEFDVLSLEKLRIPKDPLKAKLDEALGQVAAGAPGAGAWSL